MGIQRAVVYGSISGVVQTRSVFTADVTVISGDEAVDYWEPYLGSVFDPLLEYISLIWASDHVEVSEPVAGKWIPTDTFSMVQEGTNVGQALANAVAGVLIAKAPGARHFGRKFISPLTEAVATGNLMDGVLMTAMASALLAYITPLTTVLGSTLTPGVVDKTGAFHAFVGGTVSSILGSIRRRKPGVGI